MKIKGEANTCWATDRQELNNEGRYENESQTVTGHEEYFSQQYYLVGSASGKKTIQNKQTNKNMEMRVRKYVMCFNAAREFKRQIFIPVRAYNMHFISTFPKFHLHS